MAFTVRAANIDPTSMATNWSAGIARSGDKWAKGFANPRRDPRAAAAAASGTWAQNTAAAVDRYRQNVGNYDADAAIANANNVGKGRYSQAGTQKAAKFQKKAAALASAIQAGLAAIPQDRSTYQARKARADAMQDFMHNQKGKI